MAQGVARQYPLAGELACVTLQPWGASKLVLLLLDYFSTSKNFREIQKFREILTGRNEHLSVAFKDTHTNKHVILLMRIKGLREKMHR